MLKLDKKPIYKTCEPKRLHTNHCENVGTWSSQFHVEHKWEGIVLAIDNDEITSRMYDFQHDDYDEFVFEKSLIPEDDIELLEEGALFYYFVGYTMKNGKKKKADHIKFRRRVPAKIDIEVILRRMEELDFGSIIRRH